MYIYLCNTSEVVASDCFLIPRQCRITSMSELVSWFPDRFRLNSTGGKLRVISSITNSNPRPILLRSSSVRVFYAPFRNSFKPLSKEFFSEAFLVTGLSLRITLLRVKGRDFTIVVKCLVCNKHDAKFRYCSLKEWIYPEAELFGKIASARLWTSFWSSPILSLVRRKLLKSDMIGRTY